jgi:ribosome-associated translation inhibitor RaiA
MIIQFNTDKTIKGDEKHEEYFTSEIKDGLKRYDSQISRVEVHLSDENGSKKGVNDMRCMLEARMEGRQPIAVSCEAATMKKAISGAIDKVTASLDTIIGRLQKR